MKTKLQKLFSTLLTLVASSQKLDVNLIHTVILAIFVQIGGLKFWNYEAGGIVPFMANGPFMSFFCNKAALEYKEYKPKEGESNEMKHRWCMESNTHGFSHDLGIPIMAIGTLTLLDIFSPQVELVGAVLVVIMTFGTLSFLVTAPKVWTPDLGSGEHGFPLLAGAGRLVMKDTAIPARAPVVLAGSAKEVLNGLKE